MENIINNILKSRSYRILAIELIFLVSALIFANFGLLWVLLSFGLISIILYKLFAVFKKQKLDDFVLILVVLVLLGLIAVFGMGGFLGSVIGVLVAGFFFSLLID